MFKPSIVGALLIIKVAFIYTDDRKLDYVRHSVRPTYRISWQVYPVIAGPEVSAALSEVSKSGEIKPLFIARMNL